MAAMARRLLRRLASMATGEASSSRWCSASRCAGGGRCSGGWRGVVLLSMQPGSRNGRREEALGPCSGELLSLAMCVVCGGARKEEEGLMGEMGIERRGGYD